MNSVTCSLTNRYFDKMSQFYQIKILSLETNLKFEADTRFWCGQKSNLRCSQTTGATCPTQKWTDVRCRASEVERDGCHFRWRIMPTLEVIWIRLAAGKGPKAPSENTTAKGSESKGLGCGRGTVGSLKVLKFYRMRHALYLSIMQSIFRNDGRSGWYRTWLL